MDEPPHLDPDDVLAQPTRARLFALLGTLRRPASTAELAEAVELHPNGVRMHLERMAVAGLVQRSRPRGRRGRPADTWSISPTARPGGRPPQGYHELGRWLARALAAPRRGLPGIEETGREIGRELAPEAAEDLPQTIASTFSALGFQPELQVAGERELTVCLGNCPYRDAVHENQPAVCALHKGLTVGLLDRIAPSAQLTRFTPHDPDRAGCTIEIRQGALPEA